MRRSLKRNVMLGVFLLALCAWTLLCIFVDPQKVVASVGVENTYLVAFLLAAIGGLSAPTGTSFFAAVATFAAGGANVLLLTLVGGLGIFISDTVFYMLAQRGAAALELNATPISHWLREKSKNLPVGAVLLFVFLYHGFTPLPSDVLMVALVLAGYSYRTLIPALCIGSFTIVYLAASAGAALLN